MKTKRLHYALLCLLILVLAACSQQENALDPSPEATVAAYEWKAPATLTGDVDTDLQLIAKLAEVDPAEIPADKTSSIVFLPANSNDQLAAAVQAAGNGGIVVVKSGPHYESGTVTITQRVTILGLPGAVIHSGVQNTVALGVIQPAIHVLGANRTWIAGLSFVPSAGPQDGGTAVLIENSNHVVAALNQVNGFQFGFLLEQANHNKLLGNDIVITDLALSQFLEAHGITVINGHHATVRWNQVSNAFFGVWACDKHGMYRDNYTHDNYLGLILCNVPPQSFPLPGGNAVGSQFPGAFWTVKNNYSANNLDAGYLVIDGANNNTLTNNQAVGNGSYGIELVGDSQRFGFFTPTSANNTVNVGPYSFTVKDCGLNNTVNGGTQIDITADPCF